MKYKIHVSAYLEESNQLLVSFSSDDTKREANDYQSMAFDVVPYGDITASEIVKEIAKAAPTICEDMKVAEVYENDDERSLELKNLVGRDFEYTDDNLEGIKEV